MTQSRSRAGALAGAGAVLVVSPHLDDAVFACGCLIAGLARRRRRVAVATVFAGRPRAAPAGLSAWDHAAGFADGTDVVGARRAEDRAALGILKARHHWLPFRDSQYGPSPPPPAIARRLAALAPPGTAVLFPLGLFHSDHRLTREAVLELLRRRPQPLCLAYEDALYRTLPGLAQAAVARLRRAGLAPRALRLAVDA
ncbi:MAG: PIG-L family deacetylase, partial [Ignavibacteria bacterium]